MNYYIGNMAFDANYLEHHVILGMKWGHRNGPPYPLDGSQKSTAEKKEKTNRFLSDNYTQQQYTRDKKLYGEAAAKRIAKRVKDGEGVQSARHNEVNRKNTKNKIKDISGKVLKTGIAVGTPIAITALLRRYGNFDMDSGTLIDGGISIGKSLINALLK